MTRRLLGVLLGILTTLPGLVAVDDATAAAPGAPRPSVAARTDANPLAAPGPWPASGITTKANPELRAHLAAAAPARRAALGRIAGTPRVRWFANCRSCNVKGTRAAVAAYAADARRNDPDALVQLAVFGLWPKGEVVKGARPPMTWSMARYQAWIAAIAAGLGDARAVIVLEPDLAISANHRGSMPDPTPQVRTAMTAWAAAYLSATLPRATIYLDAGSADWLSVPEATALLLASGIQHVRGFALGATHYDSVASNVAYAARLSDALAAAGVPGRRAVIDTADNGSPFTWSQWNQRWGPRWRASGAQKYHFDNTPTCRTRGQQVCQSVGHRPTSDVLDDEAPLLGLGSDQPALRAQAATYVDAYLWFGRGWRTMQQGGNDARTPNRMIRMVRTSPFR